MPEGTGNKDIHMFRYKDLQLIYDVNSGSLHAVDNLGWEVVAALAGGCTAEKVLSLLQGKYPPAEIKNALQQVEQLRQKKCLFAPEPVIDQSRFFCQVLKERQTEINGFSTSKIMKD